MSAPEIVVEVDIDQALVELAGPFSDRQMMAALGATQLGRIKLRTFVQGKGLRGGQLKPYSTKGPLYVTKGKGTGARLAPKGGKPSKSGKSVRYDGGYADYKKQSAGSSTVNYALSGRTAASMGVLSASATRAEVGFSGAEAQGIATGLQARDEFFGIGPGDEAALVEEAGRQVQRIIDSRKAQG